MTSRRPKSLKNRIYRRLGEQRFSAPEQCLKCLKCPTFASGRKRAESLALRGKIAM